MTKSGAGTLTLGNTNAYNGATIVTGGTLRTGPAAVGVTGFGGNGAGWTINSSGISSTAVTGNVLTLTDGNVYEIRTAFYNNPVPVGGFNASFVYQVQGAGTIANGMAFVLQNDTRGASALGGAGSGLGVGNISTGVAIQPSAEVEFSIYPGDGVGTAYAANGVWGGYTSTGPVNLANGDPIQVNLSYAGSNLVETLKDLSNSSSWSTTYTNINLAAVTGGSAAYVGLTGAAGGYGSTQTISNFAFTSLLPGSGALPTSSAVQVAAGATFDLSGAPQTIGSLAGSGTVTNTFSTPCTLTIGTDGTSTAFSGAIADGAGTLALVKVGSGTLMLSGSNGYSGGTTISGGTLNINADAALGTAPASPAANITFSGNGALQAGAATVLLSANRNIAINGGITATIDTQSNMMTIPGAVTGAGSLAKAGAGTLTLTGSTTYTGATTVQGGLLVLQGNSQSSSFTADSGGTLQMAGNTLSLSYESLTAQSGGAVEYNAATINGGYLHGPGVHVTLPGGTSNFNGVTTYTSALFQQNGPANFANFTNGGQLANNTTLNWNGGGNSSSGTLNVNAACNVQDFTNNGVVTVNSGGTLNNAVSDITLGAASRTTINPGGQLNANSDGSGSAVDLNGALLVNNGTVVGTTNVYYGALAQGSGTYGSVNVYNGGQFKPGNSPGQVTTGPTTWNSGGQYLIEINDATGTAGTNWNLWNINGPLALDAGTTPNSRFNLVLESESGGIPGLAANFDDTIAHQWLIAETSGGISGFDPDLFSVNTTGFANNLGAGHFYVSQTGNAVDLNYTPTPEPSTLVLLAAGAAGLVGYGSWRRGRKRSLALTVDPTLSGDNEAGAPDDGPAVLSLRPCRARATRRAA